jgi:hypothetical protein
MLVLFVLAVLLAGCTPRISSIRGSGNVVTQEVDLSGFDRKEGGTNAD